MKLRIFKKSLHRKRPFKHTPRYESKIFSRYTKSFAYYTCHKLKVWYWYDTKELVYIIKKKGVKDE